jgi:hypothetical protein
MSEAKCGIIIDQPSRCPGCRFAHPGYLLLGRADEVIE